MEKHLEGKIALVTGASRGIGAAVAKRLAAEGAHVILAARTVGGLEAVDDAITKAGGKATLVPLDLAEHDKIDHLGVAIAERFGKLDILVGNAGTLGELTPLTHAEASMWDRVIAVNLTANWRLIRICDPLLRRSEAGRAIFVTSGTTQRPKASAYWGPYAVSKAGLETLVETYAAEVTQTNVKVNLVDPGVVRTKMRAHAMPGEDPMTLPEPDAVTDIFVKLASPECKESGERFAA
ncbi:MAG TPA: SDR family NAD(P)-dependent oxidoreductase [Rickettsiales bacterium]|nr:SDR family NAD(P)-dependent oxidoreductase [Rickettsiales bacterium]